MKKILVLAIAAVSCFCSCLMESHEDYIYTIELGFNGRNEIITSADPEGKALVNEFEEAVASFKSSNKKDWMWVETIDNGRSSKADAAAKKKFDSYKADVQSLFNKYQAKFDALPDNGSLYETSYTFMLYRSIGGDKTLDSVDYNISYGK